MDLLRQFVSEREELATEWRRCARKREAASLDRDDWEYRFWKFHEDLMARQIECHEELVNTALSFVMTRLRQEKDAEYLWANTLRDDLRR